MVAKELARMIAAEIGDDVAKATESKLKADEDVKRLDKSRMQFLLMPGLGEAASIASLIIGGTALALQFYDRVKGRKALIKFLEMEIGQPGNISDKTRHDIIERIADKFVEQY